MRPPSPSYPSFCIYLTVSITGVVEIPLHWGFVGAVMYFVSDPRLTYLEVNSMDLYDVEQRLP